MRFRTMFTTFTLATLTFGAVGVWSGTIDAGPDVVRPAPFAREHPPEPTPQTTYGLAEHAAAPLLAPGRVDVAVDGFYSWALLDRRTGTLTGSANDVSDTNSTESMIKIWIASDYLRRLAGAQPDVDRMAELSRMIRDSDDAAAEDAYQIGGGNAVVQRMISICGLTDTSVFDDWWSRTQVSARDAVRLGACVADGRAAGPTWTAWILGEMRQVRGEGRFGVVQALPDAAAGEIPIKNGWTVVGDEWHVNCLAVVDRYVLAVLTRYPQELGLDYGAGVCRSVTAQLRPRG
ncbi:hypothetical protein ACNTMW_03480 [Planosporangium sp. 12N6]|uniref:hypothetical protein n=1 Tax=Planosporangium spinosum TaxID=3402278 RepID=UPI003CF181F7